MKMVGTKAQYLLYSLNLILFLSTSNDGVKFSVVIYKNVLVTRYLPYPIST